MQLFVPCVFVGDNVGAKRVLQEAQPLVRRAHFCCQASWLWSLFACVSITARVCVCLKLGSVHSNKKNPDFSVSVPFDMAWNLVK